MEIEYENLVLNRFEFRFKIFSYCIKLKIFVYADLSVVFNGEFIKKEVSHRNIRQFLTIYLLFELVKF